MPKSKLRKNRVTDRPARESRYKPNAEAINWPADYPLALAAQRAAEERREARRKQGHGRRPWKPPLRYARSYAKGDDPAKPPTGPQIVHAFSNRHDRRRQDAEARQKRRGQRHRPGGPSVRRDDR